MVATFTTREFPSPIHVLQAYSVTLIRQT